MVSGDASQVMTLTSNMVSDDSVTGTPSISMASSIILDLGLAGASTAVISSRSVLPI